MRARKRFAAGLVLALLILAVAGWISYTNTTRLIENSRHIRHTYRLREHLATVISLLKDAETGARGYVITGHEDYLAPWYGAVKAIDRNLRDLHALSVRNPMQRQRLDALRPLIAARLGVLGRMIAVRREKGLAAAAEAMRMDQGKQLMDHIRASLGDMKNAETALLRRQEDESKANTLRMVVALTLGALIGFSILLLVFYFLNREISERGRAEQALRESESRYRAVSELTSDYTYAFRVETDGAVVVDWVAGAFTRITGYTPEEAEALGGGINLVHPEDFPAALRRLQTLVSGQSDTSEFRIITKSGEVRWVRETGRSGWDPVQGKLRVLGAAQDITERKQAEAEARQHQAELAHLLRVGTIGEMAAGLAHEINQPLSAIVSYAKGCARRMRASPEPSAELLDVMESIAAQAVRADQIVRRLRSFVRKEEPRRERVDLNDLVRDVTRLAASESRHRKVAVRLDLAPELPPIQADSIQIEQVILNLIRNGLEAMHHPDVDDGVLSIRTSASVEDTVEVAVCDSGEGLAAEHADRMFDPFFTTKPQGLGMGLSISRSIIEAHGGRLWATQNPDRGATFRFTVPVSGGDHADAA